VQRKGIYQAGKTGWVYYLDRTNGQPLIGIDEKPVPQEPRNATAATQPYPVGDPFMDQCPEALPAFPLMGCIFTPFWDIPVLLRPTGSGGSEWSPSAYSPQTGYSYVFAGQTDSTLAMRYLPFEHGKTYSLGASVPALGASIKSTFTAIDSRTNKIAWQQVNDGEQSYGALATAGGLVFKGQVDGNLVAVDATSGAELWRFQTGLGISAPPMTWSDGKDQFVTVAVGGNRGGATTLDGDEVWTFSLNGLVDQVAAPPPIQTKVALTGAPVKLGDKMAPPQTVFYGDKLFDGTLYVEDYTFTPSIVQVPAGTSLTWINNGSVAHTATSGDGSWDTGDIPGGGGQTSVTFQTAGTYNFFCTPHPWMIGRIVVQ
jgi:quinohemoprotein ethanol dehydrogenase